MDYAALGRHFDVRESDPTAEFRSDDSVEFHDPLTDEVLAEEMNKQMGLGVKAKQPILPVDSAARKDMPVYRGVLAYFPRALAYVAKISKAGADKHCGGELMWDRSKSSDHLDCIARHLIDNGTTDPEDHLLHDGKLAWRALANLELVLEQLEKDSK